MLTLLKLCLVVILPPLAMAISAACAWRWGDRTTARCLGALAVFYAAIVGVAVWALSLLEWTV